MGRSVYEAGRPGRKHTIMSPEDREKGKPTVWDEIEIKGNVKNLSPTLFDYTHLRVLYMNDNQLQRIPSEIAKLQKLQVLDLSNNRLRGLPAELGDMPELRVLNMESNQLRQLPYELGKLFQLEELGLANNPLTPDLQQVYDTGVPAFLQYMLDRLRFNAMHPPQRPWMPLAHPDRNHPTALFTVMNYNILCDSYCTRQMYGYCPSWALHWDYRRRGILEEIRHYSADILCLQEVEKEQFVEFFQVEFEKDGYEGIFAPKSRFQTMSEDQSKRVDGCAIFWRAHKFKLIEQHKVEYSQLAIKNAESFDPMINRVHPRDNIGLFALLETKEGVWDSNALPGSESFCRPVVVATTHYTWDPDYCDVKLIQSIMMMSELKQFVERANSLLPRGSPRYDCSNMPMIVAGDFNSNLDTGVLEFLTNSKIPTSHPDFKDYDYEQVLKIFSHRKMNNSITHPFNLKSAYDKSIMEFTNFTYEFKDIIDYIFYTGQLNPLGVLGSMDKKWFKSNKVVGCPHPHIPSDHFSLLVEFELPSNENQNQTDRR
ncbi:CCR4-NOT transcription complex subunit 6-like isoform X2 [Watersipora subatra]|uniref:CCR4-NOT transcription complex subunit 6-like isoform X2 n=1 Tax=Watersipora subatra TaxID=2589382 RepID=UPI00355C0165